MSWFQLPSFLRSRAHAPRPVTHRKPRRPPFQKTLLFEAMEPRILLSADPIQSGPVLTPTITFAGTNDVVGIHLVSASGNGGVGTAMKMMSDASTPSFVLVV